MEIDLLGLLSRCSQALDVFYNDEAGEEVNNRSQRLALISVKMAKNEGWSQDRLFDLASLSLLSASAWTQILGENSTFSKSDRLADLKENHCFLAEENVKHYPFMTNYWRGALLYMDEKVNGKGVYHLKGFQTSLFARFIHTASEADKYFISKGKNILAYDGMLKVLHAEAGNEVDEDDTDILYSAFSALSFHKLYKGDLTEQIRKEVGIYMLDLSYETIKKIVLLYAKIIDYKSSFTRLHSTGTAAKAFALANLLGYKPEESYNLCYAGALHDFGLMYVPNTILEKPSKLSDEEYQQMTSHVTYIDSLLDGIQGLETVRSLCASHHERIDGSGYPYHLSGEKLSRDQRLLAALDVYQALREERPYRKAMGHEMAVALMKEMANDRKLDEELVEKIGEKMK